MIDIWILGPVHTYPDIFKNRYLFLRFQEKIRIVFARWKKKEYDRIPYGACVMLEVYDVMTSSHWKAFAFRPSTHKREAGLSKNLHAGERFWKDAFSVTTFTGYVWTVGQTGEKCI